MSRFRVSALVAVVASIAALALVVAPAVADQGPGEATTHPAPWNMRVRLKVQPDAIKGYNLFVTTTGFRWAPEHVNQRYRRGEGHAHLYVDGVKVTRVYGPAFYLGPLASGTHTIRVTLNGNDHGDYVRGGQDVASQVTVTAP